MNDAARRLVLMGGVALLSCAHGPAVRPANETWVRAARLTGPALAREVLVPAHPPLVAPGPEVDPRVTAFSGAWEGTWSDGASSVLLVLALGPSEARFLLAMDGDQDPRHPPWHAFAFAAVSPGPEPALVWTNDLYTDTFTLGADGLLRGSIVAPWMKLSVVMRRRPVEVLKEPPRLRPFVCPAFAPLLAAIEGEADPAKRRALVEALVAQARDAGGPLVGPGREPGAGCATFLWRGAAAHVALAGDMNGWSRARDLMERIPGTDLFHAGFELPDVGRVEYKLLPDGNWILDPLNPHTMTGGYGPNSELRMPGYRPPPEVERRPGVPAGTLESLTLRSRHLGNGRKARVYLPPGYAGGTERYPVIYLQDGDDELAFGALDAVLDNLIATRAIPPVMAVLVPPVRRREEYVRSPAFEAFFLEEVVPAVDARYRTQVAPAGRVVGGISLGGLAAASLALGHPDVFGACISQSGAYGEKLADLLDLAAATPTPRRLRVWLDVGVLESVMGGSDLLGENRRLRDALAASGFPLRYREVPEGHSWGSWRARIGQAIAFSLEASALKQ